MFLVKKPMNFNIYPKSWLHRFNILILLIILDLDLTIWVCVNLSDANKSL